MKRKILVGGIKDWRKLKKEYKAAHKKLNFNRAISKKTKWVKARNWL